MASVNINYIKINKTKEDNCWDIAGSNHKRSVRKPRTSVDSNLSCSKTLTSNDSRTVHITRGSSSVKIKDTTQPFIDHKKSNNNRRTQHTAVDRSLTEVIFQGSNDSKTLQRSNIDVLKKTTTSSDPLNCSKVEKCFNNAITSNENDTNHIATSTGGNDNALEEKRQLRRERMKEKKEIKKQEKAVLREEEMRKKRLGPKDQKVTIIDHNILDRFLVKETQTHNMETKRSVYCGSEFPSLGEVMSIARSSSKRYQKKYENKRGRPNLCNVSPNMQIPPDTVESLKTSASQRNISNPSVCSVESDSANVSVNNKPVEKHINTDEGMGVEEPKELMKVEDKATGKRPKRRDPIHLDFNEILKVQETKHEVSVKQNTSKPTQKLDVVRYSGNTLDSDNPERKRGKQREVPKAKKPSSLKQIILQERAKRKEARLQETSTQVREVNSKNADVSNDGDSNKNNDVVSAEPTLVNVQFNGISLNDKENKSTFLSETHNTSSSKSDVINKEEHVIWKLHPCPSNIDNDENILKMNEELEERQDDNENSVDMNSRTNGIKETKDSILFLNYQTIGVVAKNEKRNPIPRIHSRKFRDYCDHYITPDILTATTTLLEDIVKFHDRQFARSPLKASAKRRHVTGLKEVRRFLTLRRIRLLVIAPDLEHSTSTGGLEDLVTQLKDVSIANEVPYVFALGRRKLGYVLKKKVPVSCVGVLNYDGTERNFHNLMSAVETAREEYKLRVAQVHPLPSTVNTEIKQDVQAEEEQNIEKDVNKEVIASLLAKLTMSRNTDTPSPFLEAIERSSNVEFSSEDET